jgi:hemerythrin-like domain-containing protein
MKPIGPLMWEHRLIEHMVDLLRVEIDRITSKKTVNVILVEQAVDFFRTYADRTHHGKEEEILFRDLAQKKMSPEHRNIMDELVREHFHGRELVRKLVEAKDLHVNGYAEALPHIARELKELVEFYPKHIEKEDKRFFFPCLEYFTQAEQDRVLQEFRDFDRNMIHEKYRTVVETFLGKQVMRPVKAG